MGGAVGTIVGAVIGAQPVIPPPDFSKLKIAPPPPAADAVDQKSLDQKSTAVTEWKTSKPKPPPADEDETVKFRDNATEKS